MKARLLPLLLLLAPAAVLVAADKSDKSDKSDKPAVSIKNLQYAPDSITIKPGQTVVWTNNDDRDHTVTGKDFNSATISVGGTFQHTFAKAATYPYSCKYHPRMKGTVIVK